MIGFQNEFSIASLRDLVDAAAEDEQEGVPRERRGEEAKKDGLGTGRLGHG